jgi:hypothetical protein
MLLTNLLPRPVWGLCDNEHPAECAQSWIDDDASFAEMRRATYQIPAEIEALQLLAKGHTQTGERLARLRRETLQWLRDIQDATGRAPKALSLSRAVTDEGLARLRSLRATMSGGLPNLDAVRDVKTAIEADSAAMEVLRAHRLAPPDAQAWRLRTDLEALTRSLDRVLTRCTPSQWHEVTAYAEAPEAGARFLDGMADLCRRVASLAAAAEGQRNLLDSYQQTEALLEPYLEQAVRGAIDHHLARATVSRATDLVRLMRLELQSQDTYDAMQMMFHAVRTNAAWLEYERECPLLARERLRGGLGRLATVRGQIQSMALTPQMRTHVEQLLQSEEGKMQDIHGRVQRRIDADYAAYARERAESVALSLNTPAIVSQPGCRELLDELSDAEGLESERLFVRLEAQCHL